jgi:hypothetical protein
LTEVTVDSTKFSASPAHPSTEEDAALEWLEPPHGCIAGVVYIGHMVEGKDGEEVEVITAVLCRRCADSR